MVQKHSSIPCQAGSTSQPLGLSSAPNSPDGSRRPRSALFIFALNPESVLRQTDSKHKSRHLDLSAGSPANTRDLPSCAGELRGHPQMRFWEASEPSAPKRPHTTERMLSKGTVASWTLLYTYTSSWEWSLLTLCMNGPHRRWCVPTVEHASAIKRHKALNFQEIQNSCHSIVPSERGQSEKVTYCVIVFI